MNFATLEINVNSSADWNPSLPLSDLVKQVKSLFYSLDRSPLAEIDVSIIERCRKAIEQHSPDGPSAATLIGYLARWSAEQNGFEHALELKHAYEVGDESTAEVAIQSLTQLVDPFFRSALSNPEVDSSLRNANPIAAVEQTYFVYEDDESFHQRQAFQDFLRGALVLTVFRDMCMKKDPSSVGKVFCALREGYGYFMSGKREAAIACREFVDSIVDSTFLEAAPDELREELLAPAYAALSTAAERGKCVDLAEPLLLHSLKLAPSKGNARADILNTLGMRAETNGKKSEALRWFKQGLEAGPSDPALKEVLRVNERMILAEKSGKTDFPTVSDDLTDALEMPKGIAEVFASTLDEMVKGEAQDDESLASLVSALFQSMETPTSRKPFGNYLTVVKTLISMEDDSNWPTDPRDVMATARDSLPSASPGERLEFENLESIVQWLSVEKQWPTHSGDPTSIPEGKSSDHVASSCSQVVSDWQSEIAAVRSTLNDGDIGRVLSTLVLMLMKRLLTSRIDEPPLEIAELTTACDLAIEAGHTANSFAHTAEETQLIRNEFYRVIRALAPHVVLTSFCEDARQCEMFYSGHLSSLTVMKVDCDPQRWALLERFTETLKSAERWILRRYQSFNLASQLSSLSTSERIEYQECCDRLAELLSTSYTDPLFYKKISGKRSQDVKRVLKDLRQLSILAQLDFPQVSTTPSLADPSSLSFYLFDLIPGAKRLIGLLESNEEEFALFSSASWSQAILQFEQASKQGCAGESLDRESLLELDRQGHLLRNARESNQAQFDSQPSAFTNLTRIDIPFHVAIDPELTSPANNGKATPTFSQTSMPQISFWGCFPLSTQDHFHVAENDRQILGMSGEVLLQYPDVPIADVSQPGQPRPLLFPHFERWALKDLADRELCDCQFHTDRDASRAKFLAYGWRDVSILHLSTHGHVYPSDELIADLCLDGSSGDPQRITYHDVVGMDWSSLDLVFLNCCLSDQGQQTLGDERLSLAWAFLAGGASAVIGHRWEIPDDAATRFSMAFYEELTRQEHPASISSAFLEALRITKRNPRFSHPAVIGSFILLS